MHAVAEVNQGSSTTSTTTGSEWLLGSSAFHWKGAQLNASYHINRLELLSLSQLVLWLVDVLGTSLPCSLTKIVLSCDSKIALSWVRNGKASSRSTDRVAVKRMVNNINELLCSLAELGVQVVYRKVPGHSNTEADQLSRLLQEWKAQDVVCIGSTVPTAQSSAIIPTEDFVGLIASGVGLNGGSSSINIDDIGEEDEIELDDVQLDHIHKAQRLSASLSPIVGVLEKNCEESDESEHKAKSLYQVDGYCLRKGLLNKLEYPHGDPLSSPRLVICIPTDTNDGSIIANNSAISY